MLKMKKEMKNNGITLIALVITILVLLILAGVSIATLTGQSGILTQTKYAKEENEQKAAKEKVDLSIVGAISQTKDGILTIENFKNELINNYSGSVEGDEFPVTATVDGRSFKVYSNGEANSIEHATLATITGKETKNTTVEDNLGNQVIVPAGFKVVNQSANVTDGIIIEDVSHEATAGSQFVWIPVGEVIKDGAKNVETIELGRYSFDQYGNATEYDSSSEGNTSTQKSFNTGNSSASKLPGGYPCREETAENHSTSNIIAKDIEDFKNRTIKNHGYYIGRYEARDKDATETRITTSSSTNQVVYTSSNYIYNYVTQQQAATLSREMYKDDNFESDLTNSYAWDTAVLFLQKFDNRENKTTPYSRQSTLNSSFLDKGTSSIENVSNQDVICNIYDMASNCAEWTTETCSDPNDSCTLRGGFRLIQVDSLPIMVYQYQKSYYTCSRYSSYLEVSSTLDSGTSFRTILYL